MIKKTALYISFAALFLIPIFALLRIDSLFFPFITGKAFYFRLLVELAFAGWLVLCFIDAKYRPKLNALTIGVTVFAVITLVADLLGVNPIRSLWSNFERMEGWVTIVHLWALFMTTTCIFGAGEEGKRMWHRWINMELSVALIVGIYGVLQLIGKADIHQGSTRIDASLGNAAYMAVYMLWNSGLAVYMFLVERAKKASASTFLVWSYAILSILFAYELFETATRGTILGLIGGILLALFLYAVVGKNEPKKKRWTEAIIIVAMLVIGGVFWAERNSSFVQNHEVLQRLGSISWSEAQGQARNYIWPIAIKGFTDRPILGWGQENFNYIFNINYNPAMWNQEQWFDRAHSVFLDWLTASGVLGLLAYLALYVFFLMAVWKSSLTVAEKSALTGLIAGYAVHNIFVFDNLASYILFFAALAFAASFKAGKPINWLGLNPMKSDMVSYVAAPLVVIALAAAVYFINIRPIEANTRLIEGLTVCNTATPSVQPFQDALAVNAYVGNQEIREQLLSCTGNVIQNQQFSGALKQSFFDLARKSTDDQIHATKYQDARTYTLAGSFLNIIGQFDYALPLLEEAHKLSPGKQSIDTELATDYINARHPELALPILKADHDIAPTNEDVKTMYAIALLVTGDEKGALAIYNNDPSALETIQFAQAYTMAKNIPKAISIYKKLLAADPGNANLAITLARLQYTNKDLAGAVQTFRDLEKLHPEYKADIEKAIEQVYQ